VGMKRVPLVIYSDFDTPPLFWQLKLTLLLAIGLCKIDHLTHSAVKADRGRRVRRSGIVSVPPKSATCTPALLVGITQLTDRFCGQSRRRAPPRPPERGC
jgi:hypothetical protein